MANFKLTERSDSTIYLLCRAGEIGQPCDYRGEVTFASEGFTLLRQAKREAYDHCWAAHKIPAHFVTFDVSRTTEQIEVPAALSPFLVTSEPQILERIGAREKKAGA